MEYTTTPSGRPRQSLLGMILIAGGAIALVFSLPGALLGLLFPKFVTASIAVAAITAGRGLRSAGTTSWESHATLGAILIACLWAFWFIRIAQLEDWNEADERQRATAPAWGDGLGTLRPGASWQDVQARLNEGRFNARCQALGPGEGLNPDDTHLCSAYTSKTWDIPSRRLYFFFGNDGLRLVRADFAKEQWPAVQDWFERLPGTPVGEFGKDMGGGLIKGKMLNNGLVLSAERGHTPSMAVIWQSSDHVRQTICRGATDRDPKWQLLCRP